MNKNKSDFIAAVCVAAAFVLGVITGFSFNESSYRKRLIEMNMGHWKLVDPQRGEVIFEIKPCVCHKNPAK